MTEAIISLGPLLAQQAQKTGSPEAQAKTGLSALFFVILVPIIIALIFIVKFIYTNTLGKKFRTTLLEDFRNEANAFEKAGKFISAAEIYENRLKDTKKAAALYEKGQDYKKAAALYDFLGVTDKAKELYTKVGKIGDAAEISMREGDYEEAAKLFDQSGKKIDGALIMERAGRGMAAVRMYREAGDYKNAARLLEQEGMKKEAAEMYGLGLRDKEPDDTHIGDFYFYAFKLEKAGETEKALEVYRKIDSANSTYKDVREKIQTLAPQPKDEEENLEGKTTLRSFIRSGRIEPKHSMKLWVQILRALQTAQKTGRPFGLLSPENIAIDSSNAISFLKRKPSSAYTPPETIKGLEMDERADIYSLGIILYEMLTGGLEGLGTTRVIDLVHEVPEWLDEIVIRCIRKVREDRYQSIEEIFSSIKALSQGKK